MKKRSQNIYDVRERRGDGNIFGFRILKDKGNKEYMDIIFSLILSFAAVLAASITKKIYIDKSDGGGDAFLFNAVGSTVATVVLFIWGGFGDVSLFTLLLGALFGAATAVQAVTNMYAISTGPLSYTTVICSFSTLISAMSGVTFFGESVGIFQVIGIVMMLVSFVLAVEKKCDERRGSVRWLVLCVITLLLGGCIGIMQKLHQSSEYKGELNAFLIIAFAVSTVLSVIISLLRRRGGTRGNGCRLKISVITILMLISGIGIAANNKLNLYLSGVMDSAVFFPLINGGSLILTTLAALAIFKERLSFKQWVGVALGTASVIMLCINV